MFNKYYLFYFIFASFCQKNKRVNTDISAVCWSAGAFSQIKFNLSLDVVLSLSKDTLVKHLPQLFISSMCSQLRKMGSVMEQFSKVNFFWLITDVVQWNHNITKGQGQATGRICLLYNVALYWGSFSYILLLLGYWKSFVIPRTSLFRGLFYWGSTVASLLMLWLSNSVSKEHIIIWYFTSNVKLPWFCLTVAYFVTFENVHLESFFILWCRMSIFKIIEDTDCKRKWGKRKWKKLRTKFWQREKAVIITDLSTNFKGQFIHHPWISVVAMHLGMKTLWLL